MADMTKTTDELKVELNFADGDTRVFRLKNPKADQQTLATQIAEINTLILNNQLLIGDKAAGAFTGIYRVTKVYRTITTMDINQA